MQVFRIALRLIRNSWPLFAIYVLALSAMGMVMGTSVGGSVPSDEAYQRELPRAAVIDRDGSEVSQALEAFVRSESTYVELEDSTYALQDAAARDVASYVLVIPEGWGEDMLAAAREGTDAPALETIVSYSEADGTLMDERVRGWAQELYALAAASDAPASDLISWLGDVQSSGVEVSRAEPEEAGVPTDYLVYVQFATYPLFGGIAAIVSQGLASLRDPDVRRRLGASSVSDGSFRCQTGMAIGFCGVLVWALNGALGFMVYRDALAGVSMGAVLLIQMALLALALVGTGFGFLLWQLGVSHEVAHAVANIASMVLTFLAGTWVSIDQMGPAIEGIARLTPGYWCVQGIVRVYEAPRITLDVAADVAACAGVTALFAVAVVSVALALGRVRDREAA